LDIFQTFAGLGALCRHLASIFARASDRSVLWVQQQGPEAVG
jgi:hypothetical protein